MASADPKAGGDASVDAATVTWADGLPNSLEGVGQSREMQKAARCCTMQNVDVVKDELKGLVMVATHDIPLGTVVTLEWPLLPKCMPSYMHPRSASDCPWFVLAVPLLIIPKFILTTFTIFMDFIRFCLNACEPHVHLYGVGSVMSHGCFANAVRVVRDDGLTATVTRCKVAAGDEITFSYMDIFEIPMRIRRIVLYYRYGFKCRCSLCCSKLSKENASGLLTAWKSIAELTESKVRNDMSTLLVKAGGSSGDKSSAATAEESRKFWSTYSIVLTVVSTVNFLIAIPILSWAASRL